MKLGDLILKAVGVIALLYVGYRVGSDRWQFIKNTPKGYEVLEAALIVIGCVVGAVLLIVALYSSFRGTLKGLRRNKSQI
jgi:hypothetical protein